MSHAIRFLPRDPRDASPALYLSTDGYTGASAASCRITSSPDDVDGYYTAHVAGVVCGDEDVVARCRRNRLVADVVPLADALRDLGNVEPRPRSYRAARALCPAKARHAGRRR